MVSNEVPAVLSQAGHELVVHTVVTGGQALLDTLHGAAQLVKQLDDARFVVWLNPFWGPIADDGKTFKQMKILSGHQKADRNGREPAGVHRRIISARHRGDVEIQTHL